MIGLHPLFMLSWASSSSSVQNKKAHALVFGTTLQLVNLFKFNVNKRTGLEWPCPGALISLKITLKNFLSEIKTPKYLKFRLKHCLIDVYKDCSRGFRFKNKIFLLSFSPKLLGLDD